MNTVQIVIPARRASSRLADKLLQQVQGKSILQHTYESASKSKLADGVIVAVDDAALAEEVAHFGGNCVMTSLSCESGTDRVAEVAKKQSECDIFVNVQGDEPEIHSEDIDQVIRLLQRNAEASAATLAAPIRDSALYSDPNCVKAVLDARNFALYFGRCSIPYSRDQPIETVLALEPPLVWQHIGLYAYRRETLEWFSQQEPSRLEKLEKLEQLRILEAGLRIVVGRTDRKTIGIDTPMDLENFRKKLEGPQ